MLKIKTGDLFDNVKPNEIIMHGCNALGVMGSGFALEIKKRYPEAYVAYRGAFAMNRVVQLGEVIPALGAHGVMILNAITQQYYGRDKSIVYVNYDAVELAAVKAAGLSMHVDTPVHLPFIGAGLANGDEKTLLEIFETAFEDTDATLWRLP